MEGVLVVEVAHEEAVVGHQRVGEIEEDHVHEIGIANGGKADRHHEIDLNVIDGGRDQGTETTGHPRVKTRTRNGIMIAKIVIEGQGTRIVIITHLDDTGTEVRRLRSKRSGLPWIEDRMAKVNDRVNGLYS